MVHVVLTVPQNKQSIGPPSKSILIFETFKKCQFTKSTCFSANSMRETLKNAPEPGKRMSFSFSDWPQKLKFRPIFVYFLIPGQVRVPSSTSIVVGLVSFIFILFQ